MACGTTKMTVSNERQLIRQHYGRGDVETDELGAGSQGSFIGSVVLRRLSGHHTVIKLRRGGNDDSDGCAATTLSRRIVGYREAERMQRLDRSCDSVSSQRNPAA